MPMGERRARNEAFRRYPWGAPIKMDSSFRWNDDTIKLITINSKQI